MIAVPGFRVAAVVFVSSLDCVSGDFGFVVLIGGLVEANGLCFCFGYMTLGVGATLLSVTPLAITLLTLLSIDESFLGLAFLVQDEPISRNLLLRNELLFQ